MKRKAKLHITWNIGGQATEAADVTARMFKAIGGHIVVSSSWRSARVGHLNNMSPRWFVEVNNPVGTKGAIDNWEEVDEDVATFAVAMSLAKKIARGEVKA